MESKYVRGQFVKVAGSTQEFEVTDFKKAANDLLYTIRDGANAETKGVSQEQLTGLNKFNAESWTGETRKLPTFDDVKVKVKAALKIG